MKVKVAKWGNSVAVRLPRKIADDLGLVPGTELDLTQQGRRLMLDQRARATIPVYRLQDILAAMDEVGPAERPELEDWSAVEAAWPDDDWSDIAPTDAEWAEWNPEEWKKRVNAQRKRS
jgi:antitoxin MazE